MTVKVKYYYFLDGTVDKIWKNEKERYHREDGPAVEYFNGIRKWFKNEKLHREDGPAFINTHGICFYYLNDIKYSKEDYWEEIEKIKKEKRDIKSKKMTSKVEYFFKSDGTFDKFWETEEEQSHREDGPAYESSNGIRTWFKNGMCHRDDGPAIIHKDGSYSYYLNDQRYSKEEYWEEIEKIKKTKEENKNDSKN